MFKYNFSLLKNKKIKIGYKKENSLFVKEGKLENVKIYKDKIDFIFDDSHLEVLTEVFNLSLIRKEEDVISIIYDPNNLNLSGMIGFTMSDTYGFPIEITEEILSEKGYKLDIEGYIILKEIQKEKSRENSNFKNTF